MYLHELSVPFVRAKCDCVPGGFNVKCFVAPSLFEICSTVCIKCPHLSVAIVLCLISAHHHVFIFDWKGEFLFPLNYKAAGISFEFCLVR